MSIATGTKRKTTEADGSSSDDKRTSSNPDLTSDPPIKKSKSELSASGGVAAITTATVGKHPPSTSKIADLIKRLNVHYEIIPAQAPDKVKNAISNALKLGFQVPAELEAYFMACDGFKPKADNTELLFFGLKSIIDTERGDDLNGCLVDQIEEDAIDDTWKENNEVEPLKPDHTKKGVLIGAAEEFDDLFIYVVCDPKSPYYSKIVSRSSGFSGTKLAKNTLEETFVALLNYLEERGHEESSTIFIPDFREHDDDDEGDDGDYKDDDDDE